MAELNTTSSTSARPCAPALRRMLPGLVDGGYAGVRRDRSQRGCRSPTSTAAEVFGSTAVRRRDR